jgi:hypothetical protein
MMQTTRAKVVISIYGNDFTRPLDKARRLVPRPLYDIDRGMKTILQLTEGTGVTVRMMQPSKPVDVSELIR